MGLSDNNEIAPVEDPFQDRRSDYDVTNTVRVSSTRAVRDAVKEIYESLFPDSSFDPVWIAFHDFEWLFYGRSEVYHAVDTTYHDVQHTLDMTLAAARLAAGYELMVEEQDRFGAARAQLLIVCSLFHDVGYLRHKEHDKGSRNGAEFTRSHVSRSGRFLESYLPAMGLEEFVPVVSKIVHFTGYEMHPDQIELEDPKDSITGHLLGTADLLAQIADRCYLEKCRDRLYPEFVLGNVAVEHRGDTADIVYVNGNDLLSKTLDFFRSSAQHRLDHTFNKAYRYMEGYFPNGENPYVDCVKKNLKFLKRVIETDSWDSLRRRPPCEVPDPDGVARVISLAGQRLKELSELGVTLRGRVEIAMAASAGEPSP
jgi:hypothetical protein